MDMGIDRIGGATYPNNVGRVDDATVSSQTSVQGGLFARTNLTITESKGVKSAAELGFDAEPTRNDELTPILSRYAYPPPAMPVWG